MSKRNVDIVVGTFEAVNARDFAAVMDAYADDIVLEIHGDVAGLTERAAGKGAVGEWFGDWFRQFERDYRFEVHDARDWGDRVLITATHHGKGRSSGAPMSRRASWVYTVRDGKIVHIDAYSDIDSALASEGGGP